MAADNIQTLKERLGVDPLPKNQKYPTDPSTNTIKSYVSPKAVSVYEVMDDCYYGSGHVRNGEYLIPFNREYHYQERREISAYKNFIRPMIRALIEPVFNEEAPRMIQDENENPLENTLANTFIEDVDNDGTGMQDFTEEVVTAARLHGVCFVLVDNFSAEFQPETTKEAIDARIMPYLVRKSAREVEDSKTDDFGRLTQIIFSEDPITVNGKKERRGRLWTKEYSVVVRWAKKSVQGKGAYVWLPAEAPVYHNLPTLPVVSVYAVKRRMKTVILVDPPMYDMAMLNLVIWNKDSEIRDLERSQAFSLLTLQTDNVSAVTVGPKNCLVVPMDATIPPAYISPDANILKTLVENNEANRVDLFRMGEQMGVYGVQTEASGVSLAWRFYGQEAQLKATSRMATTFEESAMEIFKAWTNEQFMYVVQYPTDFQPGDRTAELDVYKKALELPGIPEALRKKLLEKAARLMLQDEDGEVVEEIVASIYVEVVRAETVPPIVNQQTEETGNED